MSRYVIAINTEADRRRAHEVLTAAPFGSRMEIKASRRTLPQNDRMWSILSDIARQLPWHGIKLRPDDWKIVFMDSLKRETRMVPNLDGDGFVDLGRSSSDLTREEMSDLMTLMEAFAAQHQVTLAAA